MGLRALVNVVMQKRQQFEKLARILQSNPQCGIGSLEGIYDANIIKGLCSAAFRQASMTTASNAIITAVNRLDAAYTTYVNGTLNAGVIPASHQLGQLRLSEALNQCSKFIPLTEEAYKATTVSIGDLIAKAHAFATRLADPPSPDLPVVASELHDMARFFWLKLIDRELPVLIPATHRAILRTKIVDVAGHPALTALWRLATFANQLMACEVEVGMADELRGIAEEIEVHKESISTLLALVTATMACGEWLTITETAEFTGLSAGEVSRKCDKGELTDNGQKRKARRVQATSVIQLERRLHAEGRIKMVRSPKAKTRMLPNWR